MAISEHEMRKAYLYAFSWVYGPKNRFLRQILERYGNDPEKAFFQELKGNPRYERDVFNEYMDLLNKGINVTFITEDDYPLRLLDIPDPPFAVFYRGKLPPDQILSVSVIGARDCSEYGKYVARILGEAFGRNGINVISGMARGIDGIAQKASMDAGGESYGVLGNGVDICYPAENRDIYDRLSINGGVLSEYLPGTKPLPGYFPPRNRIVSGLSDAVIVVEARVKSGTLITVDMALEQGKDVYVVPGRINDRLSDGCNRLIKQGAGIVISVEDMIEELKNREPVFDFSCRGYDQVLGHRKAVKVDRSIKTFLPDPDEKKGEIIPMNDDEKAIFDELDLNPKSIDDIAKTLGISTPQASMLLMSLALKGAVKQVGAGYFCLKI
ncbi:MAG: DNA-processing protein DprA [Acetatifactor sp.]|nr:DNA-processing protein DprA [Acetatifactor sp.]